MSDRLFTPRFFVMCSFTFTVFLSLFQLLPTAPYHVIDLGGSTTAAGLFLGLLTYASALSAPFTGNLGDRVGQRRVLLTVSLVLAGFTTVYAFLGDYRWMLALVAVHGAVWSALLTSSGAYMTAAIPPSRRAEGLGYWGLASVTAIAVAPPFGFWVYQFGWRLLCAEAVALNLVMAVIAWRLPDDRLLDREAGEAAGRPATPAKLIETRALGLSIALGLVSFAYGALTSFSAMFADALGVSPRSLFLTAMAAAIVVARLGLGRRLDAIGHRNALLPAIATATAGLILLATARGLVTFAISAAVFGAGFGLMFPAFAAYMMNHVPSWRRGAAYGAMIAAFDTGIGTGSSTMGYLIDRIGFRSAFAIAAGLAVLSLPYFLVMEKRLGFR
ncbi:MAG: MFS transporter [Vicinamibacterales bacterium]